MCVCVFVEREMEWEEGRECREEWGGAGGKTVTKLVKCDRVDDVVVVFVAGTHVIRAKF